MPLLLHLFKETVVLRHFWNDNFKTLHKPARLLRVSPRFNVERCATRYGKRLRRSYVSEVFNALPEDIYSITGKAMLKKWLRSNIFESEIA